MPAHHIKRHLPKIIGTAVVVGVGVGMVALIQHFMNAEPPKHERKVQQVTVVKPPPPKEQQKQKIDKPEPEMNKQEEVDISEPEPMPEDMPDMAEQPPLSEELGVVGEGVAGGDGFGLAARKSGRSLVSGGQGGDPHMWYAVQLQRQIEESLLDDEEIRKRNYSVIAQIWVANDGSIKRAKLANTTGNQKTDRILVSRIEDLPPLAEVPPNGMPQPIRLRISSQI